MQLAKVVLTLQLSVFAVRTYNGLYQSPVFPWILAESTSLDVDDPAAFRDLNGCKAEVACQESDYGAVECAGREDIQ